MRPEVRGFRNGLCGFVAGSKACLDPHAELMYSVQFSYDKGTPFARTVRKAKDLTTRQPGRRKGTSAKADNLLRSRSRSMKTKVVTRLALASAAALFIAACSSSDGPVSPGATSKSPVFAAGSPGVTVAALVQVCVDDTGLDAAYSFAAVGSNLQSGDVITTPVNINTAAPGPVCGTVLERNPVGNIGPFGRADLTASLVSPVAGAWTWTCVSRTVLARAAHLEPQPTSIRPIALSRLELALHQPAERTASTERRSRTSS